MLLTAVFNVYTLAGLILLLTLHITLSTLAEVKNILEAGTSPSHIILFLLSVAAFLQLVSAAVRGHYDNRGTSERQCDQSSPRYTHCSGTHSLYTRHQVTTHDHTADIIYNIYCNTLILTSKNSQKLHH